VPGNAVATVDGDSIPRAEYSHWLGVFTKEAAQQAQSQQGAAKPTAAQLRENTLRFLISARWLDGEASDQGLKVSGADVKKSLEDQKKQGFPKAGDYERYLKASGQSNGDVLQRVRVTLLSSKLSSKVAGSGGAVSDQAIADFYAKNQAKFVQPEKRDLRVVLTKDAAHARSARNALEAGQSWKAVTQRFSIDDQTKATAGKLPAQAKGALDKQLDDAVFSAGQKQLVGPIKTQFGYFVFEVTGVTPGSKQSLADAKGTIKQTLQSQNQQKSLDRFVKAFNARWRGKTQCSAGFRTSDCSNGPKPTPTPAAATPAGGQSGQ
jgi:foldase protein PrsA